MWTNQLPPSMKVHNNKNPNNHRDMNPPHAAYSHPHYHTPVLQPFKMGPTVFKTSDFGLGMAIQNKYLPAMAVVGEAGWGGAASTNWCVLHIYVCVCVYALYIHSRAHCFFSNTLHNNKQRVYVSYIHSRAHRFFQILFM